MVDYAKLADQAKAMQNAGKPAVDKQADQEIDPRVFFDKVNAHIVAEMNKANAELHKRGAETIGRTHLPSFGEKICLTYGTSNLCCVELDLKSGKCRIKAVISGPPNGYEISRKEFLFNHEAAQLETLREEEEGLLAAGCSPAEIAEEIISSIILGKFS